MSLISKSECHT